MTNQVSNDKISVLTNALHALSLRTGTNSQALEVANLLVAACQKLGGTK